MYCEMCGTANDDNAKKCKKCGYSFVAGAEASKEEFEVETKKFKEDNYETIRKKSQAEKAAMGVKGAAASTGKAVGKWPLPLKIVAALCIIGVIAFGVYYYIQTNNFFVPEKDPATGETYYVYYKNSYMIVNEPLYLRGKHYRVDSFGHRMDDKIYTDNDGNDYYYDKDGVLKENEWFLLDGERKCADEKGIIIKNAWKDDYYLNEEGNIVYDSEVGEYYVGSDGKYIKNSWMHDHFYGKDGKMLRNTRSTDDKQLKLDQNGNIIYSVPVQVVSNDLRFGSTILYGELEQDGNTENGPEPIEWILLHADNLEAVLLSKYVLAQAPYQKEDYVSDDNNKWESSYIKEWLEGWFSNRALDEIDRRYILKKNNDLITIPSAHDLELYIPNQRFRIAFPTNVATITTEKSVVNKEAALYWLRDDGANKMHKSFVSDVGDIINDDISDNIKLSFTANDIAVSGHTGSIGDVAKGILDEKKGDIAEELVSALTPGWLSKILNGSGLTKKAVDAAWDLITGNNKNINQNDILQGIVYPDEQKETEHFEDMTISEALNKKMPERLVKNPYKDVGLITNEFLGVRPMIVVNMEVE